MRIFILGAVASGKTTLARQLAQDLGLLMLEGDCIVYDDAARPRRKRTPQEQLALIEDTDRRGGWVAEGVYRPSYHRLAELADVVVMLDTPLSTRLRRVFTRYLRQQLGWEHSHYRSDWAMLRNMLRWTFRFQKDRGAWDVALAAHRNKLLVVRTVGERARQAVLARAKQFAQ